MLRKNTDGCLRQLVKCCGRIRLCLRCDVCGVVVCLDCFRHVLLRAERRIEMPLRLPLELVVFLRAAILGKHNGPGLVSLAAVVAHNVAGAALCQLRPLQGIVPLACGTGYLLALL